MGLVEHPRCALITMCGRVYAHERVPERQLHPQRDLPESIMEAQALARALRLIEQLDAEEARAKEACRLAIKAAREAEGGDLVHKRHAVAVPRGYGRHQVGNGTQRRSQTALPNAGHNRMRH